MHAPVFEELILQAAQELSDIETEKNDTEYTEAVLQEIHTILSALQVKTILPTLLGTLTTCNDAILQLNILFILSEFILFDSLCSPEADRQILETMTALNAEIAPDVDVRIAITYITTFLMHLEPPTPSSLSPERATSGFRAIDSPAQPESP